MHVLLATTGYPPEHAGAGGRLHGMYLRLRRIDPNLRWSVLTKRRESGLAPPAGPDAIIDFDVARHRPRSLAPAAVLREVRWLYRQVGAGLLDGMDLLHLAGWSWFTWPLCRLARKRGIPILRELTTVGDAGAAAGAGRWLICRTNALADRLVAISPALEAAARAQGTTVPIWCRPNGVDLGRFHLPDEGERATGRAALKQWLGPLAPDDVVVLQVGRIRPLKNQLFLADCVARLPARFRLLIVGPAFDSRDSYLAALQDRLAAPDLRGRAKLLAGFHAGIETLMRGADILAMPSRDEGLGTVMIEALACGLPVAASHLPGVTDWIVRPGENGALASLDRDAFGDALLSAAALCHRRIEIAAAAAEQFDAARIDADYFALLHEMAARPAKRRTLP